METAQRCAPATEQAQLDEAGFVCAEHRHDDGSPDGLFALVGALGAKTCLWLRFGFSHVSARPRARALWPYIYQFYNEWFEDLIVCQF